MAIEETGKAISAANKSFLLAAHDQLAQVAGLACAPPDDQPTEGAAVGNLLEQAAASTPHAQPGAKSLVASIDAANRP